MPDHKRQQITQIQRFKTNHNQMGVSELTALFLLFSGIICVIWIFFLPRRLKQPLKVVLKQNQKAARLLNPAQPSIIAAVSSDTNQLGLAVCFLRRDFG